MTDLEKVIKGLECVHGEDILCAECHYSNADGYGRGSRCQKECVKDAIALLKEHEPKEPLIENFGNISKIYGCPTCRKVIYRGQCFCDECGQAVKWE